jgi:hypothetical protein
MSHEIRHGMKRTSPISAYEALVTPGFALPGWSLDLLTDGVDAPVTRKAVVMAVRRIMLSAHRLDIPYTYLHGLLTDTENRRLATQVSTGRRGAKIRPRQRDEFLAKIWDQTAQVARQRPSWSREDALNAIEYLRDNWKATEVLPPRERAVLDAVLELAARHGTTRPAVPSRVIAEMTGLTRSTANRTLQILAKDGTWLRLAQRGNHRTRRASLYVIAPDLLHEFSEHVWGASPPESQSQPKYQQPTSQEGGPMPVSVTISAPNAEDLRRVIDVLTCGTPDEAKRLLEHSDFSGLRLVTLIDQTN